MIRYDENKSYTLYVLQGIGGYYYVGITSYLVGRLIRHFGGFGAIRTARIRPLRLIAAFEIGKLDHALGWEYALSHDTYLLRRVLHSNRIKDNARGLDIIGMSEEELSKTASIAKRKLQKLPAKEYRRYIREFHEYAKSLGYNPERFTHSREGGTFIKFSS